METVLWYSTLADVSIPKELLPDKIYDEFNTDHSTMMAVFFDSATSADVTMDAIREIRSIAGKQCFVSGMSALVTDLKDLCEKEEPIYVGHRGRFLPVWQCLFFLDGWLVPFVFLASIGMMILLNLGTQLFLRRDILHNKGAVGGTCSLPSPWTIRYSSGTATTNRGSKYRRPQTRLWRMQSTRRLPPLIGSSVTTVAGFAALCFMTLHTRTRPRALSWRRG